MKQFYKFTVLLLFTVLLYSCNNKVKKNVRIELNQNWEFKSKNDTVNKPAKVPGVVHLDLLRNNIISDPYYASNEQKLQWISKQEWIYSCDFLADTIFEYNNIDLIFKGLDTYADVYLNDSLIFRADNMYRQWVFSIKHLLKQRTNNIKIHFFNPDSINNIKVKQVPYNLPEIRGFTRKAPYHFGWDWAPKFLTAGAWQPIFIEAWNNSKIESVQIKQNLLDTNIAKITANIEIKSTRKQEYNIKIIDAETQKIIATKNFLIKKGLHNYSVNFKIVDPKLWWCNGLGDANLYTFKTELSENNKLIDFKITTIGLRNIQLVQELDSIGKSFYFKLNGKPVFIKGANYIPSDQFLTRVNTNNYKRTIESVVFANMNMLRVWGGGIYENEEFYNLCDKNGILIWQDFMFAGTMYPGDTAFLENVKHEATYQIKRLRNHPCIALWCGNNEVDNAWKDWGWQKQFNYSKNDSTELWNNYIKLFEKLLPNLINTYDSSRNYHPSSPTYGWGHKENFTEGDSHYWGVWWGHEPFEIFNTKVGRFMSEYGFQSIPNIKTIQSFASKNECDLTSNTMKTHQKHQTGYQTINEYLLRDYKTTNNFEDYIYLTQLVQAEGITTAIKAHRRAMPYCMGTLYWQLNDSWPVSSWSSIDYYHRKKALHYFVKEAYKNTIISTYKNKNNIEIHIINDSKIINETKVIIKQIDFYGNEIYSESKSFTLNANASTKVYNRNIEKFTALKTSVLYVQIIKNNTLIDCDYFYFAKPKELVLPAAKLNYSVTKLGNKYKIEISSNVLAKNIELIANLDGDFSNNYFDLLPKQKKEIIFTTSENGKLIIKTRSLNNL